HTRLVSDWSSDVCSSDLLDLPVDRCPRPAAPQCFAVAASVIVTFALLGALGWAAPARVIRAGVRDMRNSDFILQARACGCRGFRLLLRQLAPNLKSVLLAQFWTSIPLFILSEANLGLL